MRLWNSLLDGWGGSGDEVLMQGLILLGADRVSEGVPENGIDLGGRRWGGGSGGSHGQLMTPGFVESTHGCEQWKRFDPHLRSSAYSTLSVRTGFPREPRHWPDLHKQPPDALTN